MSFFASETPVSDETPRKFIPAKLGNFNCRQSGILIVVVQPRASVFSGRAWRGGPWDTLLLNCRRVPADTPTRSTVGGHQADSSIPVRILGGDRARVWGPFSARPSARRNRIQPGRRNPIPTALSPIRVHWRPFAVDSSLPWKVPGSAPPSRCCAIGTSRPTGPPFRRSVAPGKHPVIAPCRWLLEPV